MLRQLLTLGSRRNVAETVVPRRTFEDVVLPRRTRQELSEALVQIQKRTLLFRDWGLGERHDTGLGLAFHFAGPPGTGKTICAEAVAQALHRPLLKVRYGEMESAWAGETGKNVVAVFREARQADAVLFFDEADSIASRRFAGTSHGYEREANHTVSILLEELDARRVMSQSLFVPETKRSAAAAPFPFSRWVLVAIAICLLAAGGFLGWASAIWWMSG